MIGNPNDSNEEDLIFSNPETLEQLRQQLLDLDLQDRQSLQAIEQDFQKCQQQQNQVLSSNNSENELVRGSKFEFLEDILFHVREKSVCFTTLTQLAVRMIDWIAEQQQQHHFSLQRVQAQLDQLREINQSLACKNLHIENDVEYFREHLRAAESQLESIINQQESLQEQEQKIIEKDRLIDQLEIELEKIKGELQFYKFSTRSRKSNLKLRQNALAGAVSNKTLNSSSGLFLCTSTQDINTYSAIQRLENENQKLKRQIIELKDQTERQNSINYYEIKEQKNQQTQRLPFDVLPPINQLKQKEIYNKTSSVSVLQKGIILNFKQYLDTPRSKNEDSIQLCETQELIKIHPLSNDWSSKSFQGYTESRPAHLFYLNNQEQQSHSEKMNSQAYLQPIIQQTRQTQGSVREAQPCPHKEVIDIGVNTDVQIEKTLISNLKQEIQGKQEKIFLLPELRNIFNKWTNYLVRKRVKRSVLRANQSLFMMFC